MTEPMAVPGVTVVQHDLTADLADAYGQSGVLAWDTETSGLDPRHDALQLCQVSAPGVGTTLVQLDGGSPSGLIELLSRPEVRVVMHHAPFDLLFMRVAWGVQAANVRCTKIASKLLAPAAASSSHSLGALTAQRLGVTLNKGPVRTSDWGAGRLSAKQVAYAAADVSHLVELYDGLTRDLAGAGLAGLYEECCEFLPTRTEVAVLGIADVYDY